MHHSLRNNHTRMVGLYLHHLSIVSKTVVALASELLVEAKKKLNAFKQTKKENGKKDGKAGVVRSPFCDHNDLWICLNDYK